MSLPAIYADEMRDQSDYFAAWPPNAQFQIGDVGRLTGALFDKYEHLSEVIGAPETAKATFDFAVNADRELLAGANAAADARVADGKALLQLSFTAEAALSFSAPDCVITTVSDLRALGKRIATLGSKWNDSDFIVYQLVTAPRATILVSQKAGAEMKLEVAGNAPLNPQLMVSLDASASIKKSAGMSTKIVGEGPLTPLFRLARMRRRVPLVGKKTIQVYRGQRQTEPQSIELESGDFLDLF
jgi:hypothetical protein